MSSEMSLEVHNDDFSNDGWISEWPPLDIKFFLIQSAVFVGVALAVNLDGNINATLLATLREDGGPIRLRLRQRFHGLPIFIFHRLAKVSILSRFSVKGSSLLSCFLLNIMAEMLLSTLKVANVHNIISEHSKDQKTFSPFKCILSLSVWRETFSATLLYSICSSICFYLPLYVGRAVFFEFGDFMSHRNLKIALLVVLIAVLYFGFVVPSYAIFIRVAGSTLPLKKDARKMGDKSLSIQSAWQSFSWSARIGFFKTLASVLVTEIVLGFIVLTCVLILCHPELHQDVARVFAKYAG
ncbi:hypothetical protein N7490_010093 [Penicillium lividum]|nr:hypothetical protein N7490_010093 [Penicillium lividum]